MCKLSHKEVASLGGRAAGKRWRKQYQQCPKCCGFCHIVLPFEKRKNKFCSHTCAAKFSNPLRKQHIPCIVCGEDIKANASRYCSLKCQQEWQHRAFIEKWLKGEVDGIVANGLSISKHIRHWLIEQRGEKCELCGWNQIHPVLHKVPLQIEHKNGDAFDNSPDNLMLLCPNCHSLTPTFGALNKGNGRKARIALRQIANENIAYQIESMAT